MTMAAEQIKSDSEALYTACIRSGVDKLFSQEELEDLGVIKHGDLRLLTECINHLTAESLFKLMMRSGKPCWKVVSRKDAAKSVSFHSCPGRASTDHAQISEPDAG